MKMKSVVVLLIALVFALSMVSFTFAADDKEVKGTVAKIEGTSLTVKDAAGKETMVTVSNAKTVKVGDKVMVKGGVVKKQKAAAGY